MIPYVLELGGSDPAIVLDDAPLDAAVRGIVWGRFANAGQTCTAPKRVIVSAGVYDEVVDRLARAVSTLRLGPATAGCDVGPLIRPAQAAQLQEQLDDATARGARAIASASRSDSLDDGFFPPTLLVDVTPEMRVMHEETFGPLLPILKAADDEDAITLANRTSFGLSASVWSRDAARARRVADRLEAGAVVLNDTTMNAGIAELPHGGVKGSGTGRSHGEAGLLECVRPKAVLTDLAPTLGAPWWFAYPARMREMLDAFTRFAHGATVLERLSGIPGTLRMLLRPHD